MILSERLKVMSDLFVGFGFEAPPFCFTVVHNLISAVMLIVTVGTDNCKYGSSFSVMSGWHCCDVSVFVNNITKWLT